MQQIKTNVLRAGIVGSYVSNDFMASIIDFQLLPLNPKTLQPVDIQDFSDRLEEVRAKYETDDLKIHIIGDSKKVADLVDGFSQIVMFFAIAIAITAILLFNYSRCIKSTFIPLLCSLIAVIWLMGILNLMGKGVGVFSVLVPFLVFAIAVSHGVQVINGVAHEAAKGKTPLQAARTTFRHLHKPGLVALLSDGIGFAMLLVIDIGAIQDLAFVASIGVALVIFTNLVLLPVLMSYTGVTQSCIDHAQTKLDAKSSLWEGISHFIEPGWGRVALIVGLVLAIGGFYKGLDLKIGDLDKGAPELRAESRYNQDNVYIIENFTTSTDLMTVFVGTEPGALRRLQSDRYGRCAGLGIVQHPGCTVGFLARDYCQAESLYGQRGQSENDGIASR